jgi:hypothetical protein
MMLILAVNQLHEVCGKHNEAKGRHSRLIRVTAGYVIVAEIQEQPISDERWAPISATSRHKRHSGEHGARTGPRTPRR